MKKVIGNLTLKEMQEICNNRHSEEDELYLCENCPLQDYCDERLGNLLDYNLDKEIKV